jgi:stearoyl-CoA desaturase (delta-9 desaturase)
MQPSLSTITDAESPAESAPATHPVRTTDRIKWEIVAGIAFFHLVALAAPFFFSWRAFWCFVVLQWLTGGIGITLGYHRLLTHRSFRVPKVLEYFFTLCGTIAAQGGAMHWVATHRVHHAYSDRINDPHSPKRGFWWAHMGWLFAYDQVLDHPTKHLRYVPELARDPIHRIISQGQVAWLVALGFALLAIAGWPGVIWGIFVRTVFVYHCTWFVNSAAHKWGYKTFDTNEGSTNNWWVALLTYGEGWHNNHHAYPYSAAHGLRWWEFDMTYMTIRLLGLFGLADSIRLPRGNPAKLPMPARTPAIRAPRLQVPVPSVIA